MVGLLFDIGYSAIMMVYLAIGFFLIYRYCHVFLMCYGEIVLAGGYVAAFVAVASREPLEGFLYSLIIAVFVGMAFGVMLFSLLRVLSNRASLRTALFVTWGLALVLAETYRFAFGPAGKYVDPSANGLVDLLGSPIPIARFINLLAALLVLTGLVAAFIMNPKWRLMLRAQADNPQTARDLGVNVSRLTILVFVVACVSATTAGVLLSQDAAITPYSGVGFTIQAALAALIVGPRIGQAVIVAAILGGMRTLLGYFFGLTQAWLMILALCVLLVGFSPTNVRRNLLGAN